MQGQWWDLSALPSGTGYVLGVLLVVVIVLGICVITLNR